MKKNLGTTDSVVRLSFSVCVLVLIFTTIISGLLAWGLLFLSALLLITVFVRYCPVYAVFRHSSYSNYKNGNKYTQRLIRFLSIIGLLIMIHHFIARPWFLDWGAPRKIQTMALSGDAFTDGDKHTRAVLIHAQPENIWPWIMQLGQERGGFYSYTFLENLFRAEMHNVYELRTELQLPRYVGDTVWLADKAHYNGNGFQILAQIIPQQAYVMTGGSDYFQIKKGQRASGTWSIYLYPENSEFTWLIARSSSKKDLPIGSRLLSYLTFEVPHFIMEQKMLRTIKRLSEEPRDN